MDSTVHTPASTAETAATTPASQDGSTISQNNPNSRLGGHAAKQSVANAAMLFAGGSDDPFASFGAIEEEPELAAEAVESHDPFSTNGHAPAQDQHNNGSSSLGHTNVTESHNIPSNLAIPSNNADQATASLASPHTPSNLFADKSSSDLFGPPNPTGNDDWLGGDAAQEPANDSHQQQVDHYGQYDQSGHANHYSQEGYNAYAPQDSNGQQGYEQQYAYNNYDQSQQQYPGHEQHQYTGYEQPQEQAGYDQGQYAGYAAQQDNGYHQHQYSGYDQQQYTGYDQNQYAGYDQHSQNGYQPQSTGYDQQQQTGYQPQNTAYEQPQQNEYQPQNQAYDHQQYAAYNGYAPQQQGGYEAYNELQPQAGHDYYAQQQEQHTAYDQQQSDYGQQQQQPTYSAYEPQHGAQEQQPEYGHQDHNPEHQQQTEYGAYEQQPQQETKGHDQQQPSYAAYDPETTEINSGFEGYTQGYPTEAGQDHSDQKNYSGTQASSAYDHSEPVNLESAPNEPFAGSNGGIEGGVEEGIVAQDVYGNEEGHVSQIGLDNSDTLDAEGLTGSQEPKNDFFEVSGPNQNGEKERGVDAYNPEDQSNGYAPNPYAPQYGQSIEGVDHEQSSLQDRRPSQGTYSSYAPEDQASYAPPSHTSEQAYAPYAPSQSQPEEQLYNPYAPSTQGYTPYAPAEDQANVSYAPPSQSEENAYAPYAPQSHAEDNAYTPYTPAGQVDDYGFATNATQSAATTNEYSAYAPTSQSSAYEQTPYGADRALSSYGGSHSGAQQHETNPGRAKIPLACFSIDGKLITYFPTSSVSNQDLANGSSFGNGYGALQGSTPSQVTIRSLSSVIPSTTYATSMKPSSCPGPLFEIGGSQISALSRATGSAASTNKNKKAALIKHLQDAANDLSSGLSYYQASKHAFELKRQEDRILLIRILSLLLEHDGNMTSNTAFDKAVIDLMLAEDSDQSHASTEQHANSTSASVVPSQEERKVLREVEHCLIKGERRDAVTLAKDNKLWTHAVIIASGMDKDTWQDVVRSFMDETLDDRSDQTLKTAYGLFSGQDVKATYDLFRPKQSLNTFSAPTVGVEHDENSEAAKQSLERRKDWKRSVAMILANRSSSDLSHLTAIGDGLSVGGWLEGAHVCYLLSLPTSGVDGFDGPGGARLTLLGTHSPAASSAYLRDLDAIILTEVLEFALSLRTVPKGGEQFQGLPHLQAYRIVHALFLAEMGETKKALKYCEAITNLLKSGKMNKYYHPGLLQHLQELSDRLSGGDGKNSSPNSAGSGSWAKKKPTMDGVWGALENRFTKFIAGEDDASNTSKDSATAAGQNGSTGKTNNQVGAFTHYSAITPEATSRDVSRVQSYTDFHNSSSGQHPYNAYGGLSSSHAPPHSTSSNASFSRPASRASSTLDVHGSTGRSIVSPLSQAHQSNAGYVSYGYANRNPASASATMTTNSSSTEEQAYSDWPTSAGPSHRSRDHSHLSRGMDSSFETESFEGPYKTSTTRNAPWNDGSSFSGGDSTLHAPHANGHGAEGSYEEDGGQTTGESDRYGASSNYTTSEGQPYYGYEAHGATESTFVSNVDHDLNDGGEGQDLLSPMDALGGTPTPTFNTYAPHSNARQNRHIDDDDDDDDLGFGNTGNKRVQRNAAGQNNEDDMNGEDDSSPGVTPKASTYDQKMGGRGESEGDKSTDSAKTVDKQSDEQKPSSWFGIGRLWGSRKGTPDPTEAKATKAHMGNESSFYYDKELKRWVNKAAGDTPQAATPPPPPPRAATASPSVGRPMGAPPLREAQRAVSSSHLAGSGGPPPARSSPFSPPPRSSTSSTISELGEDGEGEPGNASPPVRPPNYSTLSTGSSGPRARSNLADHSQPPALQSNRSFSAMSDASAAGGATGSAPPRPPPGGSMKKKPISKRYVRVD
ncbi:uncharacterized protein FA14DRAFT_94198 [Meira miltonrushii]|uniref:Protein transport protein sec16 n=1 Tax=Meira miltonrushii TaxID=1280837 RepID=A0A316V7K0_9BASI|nr:uncharacterized protein FA14DRAFT_94198 [Meira miltonrushii]PWN31455.1 hypothetical protein FA14DRAFT_94198 [Meira miltonrushii]